MGLGVRVVVGLVVEEEEEEEEEDEEKEEEEEVVVVVFQKILKILERFIINRLSELKLSHLPHLNCYKP